MFNEYRSNNCLDKSSNNGYIHNRKIRKALQKIKAKNLIKVKIMPQSRFKELKIHYLDDGDGSVIVFLHGLSDSADFWKPLINEFSDGFRTIAMDLRGHGGSSETGKISIDSFTDDLNGLLISLDIKHAHIFGFSLGSLVALNFTLKYPQAVDSLVLFSSFSHCTPKMAETFQKLKNNILKGDVSSFFDEMVKLVYTPEFLKMHREIYGYKQLAVKMNSSKVLVESLDVCTNFNIKNKIYQIKVPTLIFSGCEDNFVPPSQSEELKNQILDSKIIFLDNVGHNMILTETMPKIVWEIKEFLKINNKKL